MRKVREVLRLRHALSLSYREISEALSVGKTSVGEIVRRAEVAGFTWPLPQLFDDDALERRLFTAPGEARPERPAPDWGKLHEELKRRSVTLVLLWQEYRAEHPDGYGYSRFCDLYGEWRRSVSATMRQTHGAGEKLFVDFAGDTVAVIDPLTGDARPAHIFVAALGASNFIYAEGRWSEGLAESPSQLNVSFFLADELHAWAPVEARSLFKVVNRFHGEALAPAHHHNQHGGPIAVQSTNTILLIRLRRKKSLE